MKKSIFLLLVFIFVIISALHAQFGSLDKIKDGKPIVTVEGYVSFDQLAQGSQAQIAIKTTIADMWHINSFQPLEEYLLPTKLSFEHLEGIEIREINYPLHELIELSFSPKSLAVYTGTVFIFSTLSISPDMPAGDYTLTGNLHYQACNNIQCSLPMDDTIEIPIRVVNAGTAVNPRNGDIFSGETTREAVEVSTKPPQRSEINQWLQEKGWLITFLLIFLGGLALNLTPCVYPLIPITVSFFVNQSQGKLSKSFFLATIYVLGMSITYSLLGLTAALSGGLFGSILQNPIALMFIAFVLVALAASMFGAFEIRVPQKLALIGGSSRQGNAGSLFMGLTVGLIAAPCIGPFVLSLLIFVGERGDPLLGFLMFFVLSLGLGLPFIFLGAFSGAAGKLPRSGEWMVWVRKVFGFVLIGMAIYFLETLLPASLYWGGLIATAITGGIYLGWIDKSTSQGTLFPWIKKGVGALAVLLGAYLIFPKPESPEVEWQAYDDMLLEQSIEQGKPVMIDFYADWCLPCKELDKFTFTDKRVIELSENFLRLKADLTKENSPEVQQLRQKYKILGVPTIVFIDAAGKERKDLRLTGYLEAEEFAKLMENVMDGKIALEKES